MRRWKRLLCLVVLCLAYSLPVTAHTIASPLEQIDQPQAPLLSLLQAADLVVRGRVSAIESFWTQDRTMIESNVTIAVTYSVLGQAAARVTVHTPGGFLPEAGIGMTSIHAAAFVAGEEVLLLLQEQGAAWQVVGGATGKFTIDGNVVINQDLAVAQPLDKLLAEFRLFSTATHLPVQLPTNWRQLEHSSLAMAKPANVAQSRACKWPTPHAQANFAVNLNTAQVDRFAGGKRAFLKAILNAAATWSDVAQADFVLAYTGDTDATQTGYDGVNEVLFMHKGPTERAAAAQVWYNADQTIVEADIWINDDYVWNVTGAPGADEVDLQSAVLHEFGHWLILGHLAQQEAVMFAKLTTGTLKRSLQPPDLQGIDTLYPR